MKKVPYFRGQISCRLSLSSGFFLKKNAYNKHVTIFLTQQHFVFSEKRVICFSQKPLDFKYRCDVVTKFGYAVMQVLLG